MNFGHCLSETGMKLRKLLLALALLHGGACFGASESRELSGLWMQMDDRDGRPRALIEIRPLGRRWAGRIAEVFMPPGAAPPVCVACTGALRNRPMLQLEILNVIAAGAAAWDGEILDPISGTVYKCRLEIGKDTRFLEVRGYIGLPLIGRTQHWRRYGS